MNKQVQMTDIIKHSDYRDWLRDLKQQIKAVTNFNLTLPAPQSDLANELRLKNHTALTLQSIRIASFGRKKCTPQILHSVRNASHNKPLKTN